VSASEPGKPPVSQRVEAKIGLRVPGKVEILEGVALGDQIVTAGQARLMRADGSQLTVVEMGRGQGSGARRAGAGASSPAAAAASASGAPGVASGAASNAAR
ncbi:MAG: efflux transporter periplasmic adaptor subunit, partial [Burkholderiaceae bacterium]